MFTNEIIIQGDDIARILQLHDRFNIKIEDLVELYVKAQFPPEVSHTDVTLYIGAISTLIWTNFREEIPRKLAVSQKSGGGFTSRRSRDFISPYD